MKLTLSVACLLAVLFLPSLAFAYGGGGSIIGFSSAAKQKKSGEVLGASTECVPLLTTYMKMGAANDVQEVKDLQGFLNTEMGSGLEVSGIFDKATDTAVRAFQAKYKSDVLDPWVKYGFTDATTGYVFKLTQWKINSIHCAPIVYPMPSLP